MVEIVNLDGILKELEEEDCLVCIYNKCIEIKGKSAVIRVCRDKLYVSGSGVEVYLKKRLRGGQRGFFDLTFGEGSGRELTSAYFSLLLNTDDIFAVFPSSPHSSSPALSGFILHRKGVRG